MSGNTLLIHKALFENLSSRSTLPLATAQLVPGVSLLPVWVAPTARPPYTGLYGNTNKSKYTPAIKQYARAFSSSLLTG